MQYLLTWLDTACSRDLGIADFAAELATLTGELERALGEEPEQIRIGRCPAMIVRTVDDAGDVLTRRPCGAELRHEPGWAQAPCPRCRTVWDVRGPSAARTAREIRRVWPIDRHRRYTAEEIARLALPRCPDCGDRVTVQWREATGTTDRTRTWQPTRAAYGHECAGAARTL